MNMLASTPWAGTLQTEDDLKVRYAGYLAERPDNDTERMAAATLLFPRQDQVGLALQVAQKWPSDPIVVAELDRLKTSGSDKNLPSRNDVARRLINMADNTSLSVDQRMKALDQYAALMGMKPKEGTTVIGGNVNVDQRRVFVLPAEKPMADWEAGAKAQQSKLIESSARKVI